MPDYSNPSAPTFDITTETAGGALDAKALQQEIVDTVAITKVVDGVSSSLSTGTVHFREDLPSDQHATLTSIIAAHTGEPLEDIQNVIVHESPPFSAKHVGPASLFTRVWGVKHALDAGNNYLTFEIPYPQVKFNALEIIGAEARDTADLRVLDSINGDYTGYPNYPLNQFGFTVAIAPDFYRRESSYDADLYMGMQVEIGYFSQRDKDIWINYILHELK